MGAATDRQMVLHATKTVLYSDTAPAEKRLEAEEILSVGTPRSDIPQGWHRIADGTLA